MAHLANQAGNGQLARQRADKSNLIKPPLFDDSRQACSASFAGDDLVSAIGATIDEVALNPIVTENNDSVLGYNNRIQSFPGNLIAGMGNFPPREYFEV